MNLSKLLAARAEQGKPIRIGLIGAGKFGSMILAQAKCIPGYGVVAWSMKRSERALPETDFRRCVRNWGGQVRSSG